MPSLLRFLRSNLSYRYVLLVNDFSSSLKFAIPYQLRHSLGAGEERGGGTEFSVVWWDPRGLKLGAEAPLGIRRPELIMKDVAPAIVESGLVAYNSWRERRQQALGA